MKSFKIVMIVFALVVLSTSLALAAVSTSTIHANSIPGDSIVTNDSIFDMDKTPQYPVGTKVTTVDGRGFRYAHFGADTAAGLLVAQDASESSTLSKSNVILAPASCVNTNDGKIGSKNVEITLAAVTANQYAGGYFQVLDDTGEGYTYRIKSNTATNDPASGTFRLTLYDPLKVALDATSDFCIQATLYANLEAATTTDITVAGVTCGAMDVSEAAYGWIQVEGIANIIQEGAITIGDPVVLATSAAGAVKVMAGYTEPVVGYCAVASSVGAGCSVKLNIE